MPTSRLRGSLILTHNRPELLAECITAIKPQVDLVLVVDNASDPPARVEQDVHVLYVPDQPPNLANLWNQGWDWFAKFSHQYNEHDGLDIAVLCDDAIVPEGWFAAVTAAMRQTGAAVGCSNPFGSVHPPVLKTQPDNNIAARMPGWAWVTDADKGLRADESMHFWWCDSDIDWQSRAAGGMVMIGGYLVPNMRPNEFLMQRPDLGEQAGRDGEAFAAKWGYRPW